MIPENRRIPPWKTPGKWRDLHRTVAHLLTHRDQDMTRAYSTAEDVSTMLGSLTEPMDDIGRQTCSMCPDICCLSAKIWADFEDVVFWHLTGQAIPMGQPITDVNQTCRYLGKRGCTLPRLSRPFVCVWYLCPTQVLRLRSMQGKTWDTVSDSLQTIKQYRKKMASAFISAVI